MRNAGFSQVYLQIDIVCFIYDIYSLSTEMYVVVVLDVNIQQEK